VTALSSWCFRHRRLVLLGWLVALVAAFVAGQSTGTDYRTVFSLPGTGSQHAVDLLTKDFPTASGEQDMIVLHAREGQVTDPAVRASVTQMLHRVAGLSHVTAVGSPYGTGGTGQVSQDGRVGLATVTFDLRGDAIPTQAVKDVVSTARSAQSPRLQVELAGDAISNANSSSSSTSVLIGIVAAAVILFLSFGSLLATTLPLITALVALGIGVNLIGLLSHPLAIVSFGPELAILVGLGVGVDYALFIVTRHRAGLRAGQSVEESVIAALRTAGRAVLFAGVTVCIALLGLFTLGVSLLYGAALSAALAVALTMLAAITLLPALLGFYGTRVLSRRDRRQLAKGGASPQPPSGLWWRWARQAERRPVPLAVAGGVLIVALAVPFFSLRLGVADQGNDPTSQTTRRAYDLLADGFGPGFNGPLALAAHVTSPADRVALSTLTAALRTQPGVASVAPVQYSQDGQAAVVTVYPTTGPQETATADLLHRLRSDVIPAVERGATLQVYVGGTTATFDDFAHVLSSKLPQFIGVVVALAFLLLTFVFRSLLIPLTASAMNLLSVGASVGVMVAVFQWGWGASLLGVDKTGPIQPYLPVMAFAILFGLSMDYEVFLLSRMYEEWVNRRDNHVAVTVGQAETGRVITAAASVMILVFASFILGGDRDIKMFGVGFAAAVLLDAFVIRTVLVPALMHLFGRANWWLPARLDRVLPQITLEPADNARETDPTPAGPAVEPQPAPEPLTTAQLAQSSD
jgi:RND superfamily putative drug exporter